MRLKNQLFGGFLLATLSLASTAVNAAAYDECILQGMKGTTSDLAARMVAQACKNKVADADEKRLEASIGKKASVSDYAFMKETYHELDSKTRAHEIKNTSSDHVISYVALYIRSENYKECIKLKSSSISELAACFSEREKRYAYAPHVKPGGTALLKFTTPSPSHYVQLEEVRTKPLSIQGRFTSSPSQVDPLERDPARE